MTLRDFAIGDVDWILESCQDSEIQRWTQVPRPYTREHAVEFVSGTTSEFARWVVQSAESDRPVGVISIHEIEADTAFIGYWMAGEHRGRGLMADAVRRLRDEIERRRATGEIVAESMCAYIAVDNVASRKVVERAGFRLTEIRQGPAVLDLVEVPTCVYTLDLSRDHSRLPSGSNQ